MAVISWVYIAGGLLMLIAAVLPSRSSLVTRIGGALFGAGAIAVGIARQLGPESRIEYVGSIVLVMGALVYLFGTLRDRAGRKR